MFHCAKVFVCVVRRFLRLLEAASGRRREYPRRVGEAIALAYKKHKAFLQNYARNRLRAVMGIGK